MTDLPLAIILGGILTTAGGGVCVYWYNYWENNYKGKLLTEGPYKYVRHPFYTGFILLTLGLVFVFPGFETRILFVMTLAVMIVYVPREEKDLINQYKKQYLKYMKKVRYKLIPGVY